MQPKVGIITINRNGLDDTRMCLDSLLQINYDNYEIYVIDNASNNNEGETLDKEYSERIQMIYNEMNQGFAGGCNRGIEQALIDGCDYRLLFNNDAIASPEFLNRLVEVAESDSKIGIVGSMVLYPDGEVIWCNGGIIDFRFGVFRAKDKGKSNIILESQEVHEVDYICGACFLCKREVSDQLGLLDESYFAYYEEADYCRRAREAGRKNIQVPYSNILHDVGSSTNVGQRGMSPIKSYLMARNGVLFGKKNLKGIQGRWYRMMQYTMKLGYNILFNLRSIESFKQYLRGLFGMSNKLVNIIYLEKESSIRSGIF